MTDSTFTNWKAVADALLKEQIVLLAELSDKEKHTEQLAKDVATFQTKNKSALQQLTTCTQILVTI